MDQESNEEKVCDICGHTGVVDAMLNCTRCKVNREHMYCARVLLEEFVDGWICGECESSSKPMPEISTLLGQGSINNSVEVGKSHELPAESKKNHNESRLGSGNWEKRVETGKTKYISVNEAIKLSSGEMTSVSFRWCPKPKPGSRIQDPALGSTQRQKLQRPGNTKLAVSSLQPSDAPKNRDTQKELPRDIQWAQTKARRVAKKQSFTPKQRPITNSGVNTLAANEQKISDANVLPDSEKCSWAPALNVLWKGSFNIQEDKLNPQIRAHPPSRVRRKVFEFSKKMPDVLHFELVSAKTCWLDVFNELIPNENDIALYFFPSVEGRWTEYISLVESISMRDLALRKQIDDIELFVFTSKCLPLNFQCVDENYFLWGVFHRPERVPTNSRSQKLSIQSSHDAIQGDVCEEVDMDIDMAGGVDVGRLDIPIKREPIEETSTTVASMSMEPSLHDLVPPGFEEVYWSRIQDSASFRKNI